MVSNKMNESLAMHEYDLQPEAWFFLGLEHLIESSTTSKSTIVPSLTLKSNSMQRLQDFRNSHSFPPHSRGIKGWCMEFCFEDYFW